MTEPVLGGGHAPEGGEIDAEVAKDALEELARLDQNARLAAEERARSLPAEEPRYERPAPRPETVYARPEPQPFAEHPGAPPLPPLFPAVGPEMGRPAMGVPTLPRDIVSIEDLYALYPDIGPLGSQYFLRVERVHPKIYMGVKVDGIVEDRLFEKLTTEDYRLRYGGNELVVYVVGPTGGPGQAGAAYRTLNKVKLRFPDPPKFPEQSMYPHQPAPGPMYGQGIHPQVEIRKLDLEAEERRRAYDQQQPASSVVAAVSAQSTESVRITREMANHQVDFIRSQLIEAHRTTKEFQEKIQLLMEEKTQLHRELAEAKNYSETTQIKELKERHERDMRDLKETHERDMRSQKERHDDLLRTKTEEFFREKDRITNDLRGQLDSETRKHTEERARLYEDARTQREDDRRTLTERMDAMRHDHDSRERSLKENYELQLRASETARKEGVETIERHYRERIASIEEAHARELRLLGDNSSVKERVIGESTNLRVSLLQTDLERARQEVDDLEKELRQAQDKLHKEPGEFIKESIDVAKNMLGWKSPAEVKEMEDKNKKLDWGEVGAQAVKTLAEKAPDIAKDILAARQQNQANAQAQRAAQAGQPQVPPPHVVAAMQEAERQRQLAAAQQYRPPLPAGPQGPPVRRPGTMATPPPWMQQQHQQHQPAVRIIQAPPAARSNGAVTMTPTPGPSQIPVTGVPNIGLQTSSPGAESFPRPPTDPSATPTAPSVNGAPPPVHQPPMSGPMPAPPQQVAAQPQTPQEPLVVDPKMLGQFYENLAGAIDAGVPTPAFAGLLVGEIGHDAARELLRSLDAEKVISTLYEMTETNPQLKDLSILTREGQRYTREVFAEARKIVGL